MKDTNRNFAQTLKELENWFETIGRTAQITYRVKIRPPYLVRILKDPIRHGDVIEKNYVQAVGDSIEEALERCIEAYMTDGLIDEAFTGHKHFKKD